MPDRDELQQDIDSDNYEEALENAVYERAWREKLDEADETVYLAGVSKKWNHLPLITTPTDLIEIASELKASLPRATFLEGLYQMKDFEIRLEDENEPTSALNKHFQAMTPPRDDRIWESKPKPASWTVTVDRMSRTDTVQLIDRITNAKGAVIGYSLRPEGVAYLVIHNRLELSDLVNFLISPERSLTMNFFYLDKFGKPTEPVRGQFETLGKPKWASLQDFEFNTARTLETYKNKTPKEIADVTQAMTAGNPGECFKWLSEFDRETLIVDILIHSEMGNPVARQDIIQSLSTGPYARRFTRLRDYYQAANPDEDATRVILELICRAAWLTLRPLLNFKMNPNQGSKLPDSYDISSQVQSAGTVFPLDGSFSYLKNMQEMHQQLNEQLTRIAEPARAAQRALENAMPEFFRNKTMYVDGEGNVHFKNEEEND